MVDVRVVGNMNFLVFLGPVKLSFARVSDISLEMEYETVQEGGRNDFVYTLTKGKQSPHTLVLEKGISNAGVDVLRDAGLYPGMAIKVPMVIMVMNNTDVGSLPVRAYSFDEGYVTKWKMDDLDASGDKVMIESIEIAHSGLVETSL